MGTNSYTLWLIKNSSIPSLRQIVVFSAAIYLIIFVVSCGTLAGQFLAGRVLWVVSAVILCAITLVASAAPVVLTMREIRSGRRNLLRLANVGRKALIYGYVFKTLYHIRFLLMAAVGLIPIIVVGWAYHLAAGEWFHLCIASGTMCQYANTPFRLDQFAILLLISVVMALATVSTILTNTAIGIWMVLRWNDQELALGSAILLEVAGEVPTIFFFVLYIASSLYIVLGHDQWLALPVLFVAALLGVAPLSLIGLTSLSAAEKWAWYQLENDQHL